jgi:hypothetical protein
VRKPVPFDGQNREKRSADFILVRRVVKSVLEQFALLLPLGPLVEQLE